MRVRVVFVVALASFGAAGIVSLGPGCGGDAVLQRSPAGGADGDTPDAQAMDAAGYTTQGPYRCCAPGTGKACCSGTEEGMCFEYGGLYGDCRKAGEHYEGKVICAHCCAGLTRQSILEPGDHVPPSLDQLPEGCDLAPIPESTGVCIQCGDGVCGPGENFCTCPEDCPRPVKDAGTDA